MATRYELAAALAEILEILEAGHGPRVMRSMIRARVERALGQE